MTRRAQGAEADGASLQPLLVDYFTRDGSTLMMALLRTSPQIAVGGGYPYERKYFSYLFRWAHLIERTEWAQSWNGSRLATLGREGIPMMGPPPWMPRELFGPDETGADLAEAAFRALWEEFSRRASEQTLKRTKRPDAEVRYYAEKHLSTWTVDLDRLPPVRVIALLRDPRDTYVSIISFSKQRREQARAAAMGRRPRESADRWLTRHLRRQKQRLRWIGDAVEQGTMPVVRYEDLVLDLDGVARRLEKAFGIELNPTSVAADSKMREMHVSAHSPEASIGRWREEMPPNILKRFNEELGDQMRALGFEVSEPESQAPAPQTQRPPRSAATST